MWERPVSQKIERASAAILGSTSIKRKDTSDKDRSSGDSHREKEKKDQQPEPESEPEIAADRPSVEKAMGEMRTTDNFTQTGMKVEVFESKDGLRVRLAQANGSTVKVMTAEEFMKLRQAASGVLAARGKILDQKF